MNNDMGMYLKNKKGTWRRRAESRWASPRICRWWGPSSHSCSCGCSTADGTCPPEHPNAAGKWPHPPATCPASRHAHSAPWRCYAQRISRVYCIILHILVWNTVSATMIQLRYSIRNSKPKRKTQWVPGVHVVEGDRVDHHEAPQVVLEGHVVAVPRHHVERRVVSRRLEQFALRAVHT